jgi:trigger factor
MKITVKKLPKSEVEIEGEIDADVFESYFNKALKKLGENIKLDGFRTGKVPENVLLQNIPEIRILEEMAEMALADEYPKIIESQKIDAISRPEISITKLSRNNPLGFKIKTAVLPEITLPDYKSLAKKINADITDEEKNILVSDEDVEKTILDIQKSRAPKVHMKEGATEEASKMPEPELPELNDEFVQALGPFSDVADFKAKLRENIKLEKENAQKEKMRLKIIEKIIEDSKIEVPEILINIELDKILYRMESDITQMGLKFEDYLKHLNKTKEDLRKDFQVDAEKKAKLALILNEIAKVEKITASDEEVAQEVAHILEHYKDADPERARMHAENILTNEKIFQFFESL